MRVFVVEPPAPVVTWEDADAHLKLDGDTDQQGYVEGLIAAATGHLDGPDGWLGRALGAQTLEARLDWGFNHCGGPLRLPYGPLIDVVSISYLDGDGAPATIDPTRYEVAGDVVSPVFGETWPAAAWRRETVRIRYRAGYVADVAADPLGAKLPAPIKAAILMTVGDLYRSRETVSFGSAAAIPLSAGPAALLAPFRVWF